LPKLRRVGVAVALLGLNGAKLTNGETLYIDDALPAIAKRQRAHPSTIESQAISSSAHVSERILKDVDSDQRSKSLEVLLSKKRGIVRAIRSDQLAIFRD
jgi:hypothetical protein